MVRLSPRFKRDIGGRFGLAANLVETVLVQYICQALPRRLRAMAKADILGERHRGRRVFQA